MKKVLFFFLALLLLIPSTTLALNTKEVLVVYPRILNTSTSAQDWRRLETMKQHLTGVYNRHRIPFDMVELKTDHTGWTTALGYDKDNLDSKYGLIVLLGFINGNDSGGTNPYSGSAPLFEILDSDSSSVPILCLGNGYRDWANAATSFLGGTTIGLEAISTTVKNDLRLATGEIQEAKLWTFFNGSGEWNYLPFYYSDGNAGIYQTYLIDNSFTNSTYGFTGSYPLIWLNRTSPAISDTVLVWRVTRDKNASDIIFASLFGSASNSRFAYMYLIPALSLRLCPDLYYEPVQMVACLDDLGMPGLPGLNNSQRRDGTTAEDMISMVYHFKRYGIDKAIFAMAPDFAQLQDQTKDPRYPTAPSVFPVTNEARGQIREMSKHKNMFKASVVFHNHWDQIFKGNGGGSDIADDLFIDLWNSKSQAYKTTLDSLGWHWGTDDFVSIGVFPGDSFTDADYSGDVDVEQDNYDNMLTLLADSVGVKVVRAATSVGPRIWKKTPATTLPDSTSDFRFTGPMYFSKYNLVFEPQVFYHDGFLSSDSMFVENGDDTLAVYFAFIDDTYSSVGPPVNDGFVGSIYQYSVSNDHYSVGSENVNRQSSGITRDDWGSIQTWHTYNWQIRGGQRRGNEWVKMITDVIGFAESIAQKEDYYKWVWGDEFFIFSRNNINVSNSRSVDPLRTVSSIRTVSFERSK